MAIPNTAAAANGLRNRAAPFQHDLKPVGDLADFTRPSWQIIICESCMLILSDRLISSSRDASRLVQTHRIADHLWMLTV